MTHSRILRLMTYNIHSCVGSDRVVSPERIARTIIEYRPDIVALQEVDVGRTRTGSTDQAAVIAGLLEMHWHFHPAVERGRECFGDAILSRYPLRVTRAGALPVVRRTVWPEPRGALWVTVDCDGRAVQVLNTHFGLSGRERLLQAERLVGPEWLGHPDCAAPRLLCGDFNAFPGSAPHRRLGQTLTAVADPPGPALKTFPSRWPLVRVDHVFHSPDLSVRQVQVPRTPLTRLASDHLPLIVEMTLP